MNRSKAEYNALYGDKAASGGGSDNNGSGHASGGGTVSSRDSGSDSDRSGGGGVGPENGSSGGDSRTGDGIDEVTASQVCTFASMHLQSQVMKIDTSCLTYILGQKARSGWLMTDSASAGPNTAAVPAK